jgi:hypothetical protein
MPESVRLVNAFANNSFDNDVTRQLYISLCQRPTRHTRCFCEHSHKSLALAPSELTSLSRTCNKPGRGSAFGG